MRWFEYYLAVSNLLFSTFLIDLALRKEKLCCNPMFHSNPFHLPKTKHLENKKQTKDTLWNGYMFISQKISRRRDFSRRWVRAVKTLLVYGCFFWLFFFPQTLLFTQFKLIETHTHTHHQRTGVLVCNEIKTPLVSLHYQKALSTLYRALACVCVLWGVGIALFQLPRFL